MRRITAVALNTVRAHLFTPAFITLVILILLIPFWCSNMSGDGTAGGKFKVFVTYSFLITSIILTIINISLSCSSISSESKKKTILLLGVKPIKRWEIILGKWFGVLTINIVLIVFFLLSMTVSSILVSYDLKRNFPEYRNIFTTEVELFPSSVDQSSPPQVSGLTSPSEKSSKDYQGKKETYAVSPRGSMKWTFRNIRKSPDKLFLSYRFRTSKIEEKILGHWLLGHPSLDKTFELVTNFSADKIHRLLIPEEAVSKEGEITIIYLNTDPSNVSVLFPKEEFKILYPQGDYWINLIRGAVNIFLLVAFICSVGIFFSCIVSNLTAILSTSVLILVSYLHDFAELMISSISRELQGQQAVGVIQRLSYPALKFITLIFPPLNKALPHSYIGNFLLLPFSYLISLFMRIIIFGALPLLIIAIIYISRKELGIPNE
jgi:ABC-type transport system involved in multi-copper enzyme maturation permease subunit